MKKITLYRFEREGGGVTTSPQKPDGEYTTLSRLIADYDKVLTNGNIEVVVVDTDTPDEWQEVDDTQGLNPAPDDGGEVVVPDEPELPPTEYEKDVALKTLGLI